ncbi:MAG: 2-C-methyl-D-erythritol 4-phosphate cytidylyltransferase [Deltaproteobacteria bacterium]|nr:2-C-methyl-D-erythritol 4-phosphate cytidylyltransferase [Deltaproteobacteria bacterium]
MEKVAAIIPAAGAGVRMRGKVPKQFLEFCGRPVLSYTLDKFQGCTGIDVIFLVAPAEHLEFCRTEIVSRYGFSKVRKIVSGGEKRQDSVRNGLEATEGAYELILIHDGARPFVEIPLIESVIAAARVERAVITALPARDTVKEIDGQGIVVRTYKRSQVWLAQTPQAFRYEDIMKAHRRAVEEDWGEVTDDSSLLEKMGIPVKVLNGSEKNIKVTTPGDVAFANFMQKRIYEECC